MSIYSNLSSVESAIDEILSSEEIDLEALDILFKAKDATITAGLETLCKIRANKIAMIDACKAEAARLTAKAKAESNKLVGLESYMFELLKKSGEAKVEAGTFTVGTRRSTAVYTAADFDNPEFMRVKEVREPDKELLKEALKSGRVIEGAALLEKENLSVR